MSSNHARRIKQTPTCSKNVALPNKLINPIFMILYTSPVLWCQVTYSVSPYDVSPYNVLPYNVSPYSVSPYSVSPYSVSPCNVSPYNVSP